MKLEDIARKAAKRLAIAGASAYLILNVLGCNGNATPTPSPTQNPSPKPSPTAAYTPEPTATPTIAYTLEPTATPTAVPTATATAVPTPTATPMPTPTATPMPTNAFEYAKSIGLEAAYLKGVAFDDNSINLVNYLASLPQQMRAIAESSGLLEDILNDKKVDPKEAVLFNKVIGSYQKEIETMKPWLNQLSEDDATKALALNLRNFIKADKKSMFYSLGSEGMAVLLPQALFTADGVIRMYAAEINDPAGWRSSPKKVYASTMVANITNFLEIQKTAWEVANNPDGIYNGRSIDKILFDGYLLGESTSSIDGGINAHEDMKLLYEQGSPQAKAALRIYARNITKEGQQGSAEQVRVPLTIIDAWSIGIDSIGVILYGHDVPAINITDEDIALLKKRSPDSLLVIDIGNTHYMPIQWTRRDIVPTGIDEIIQIYTPNAPIRFKIADLPKY